jgi:cytoskeletal protein RodZ
MTSNLKTPGERLQEARKAAGRELAEMAAETKIPVHLLEAIELDDFHRLSGPIYVKSFLKTYAESLKLDPQEILDLYYRQAGNSEQVASAVPEELKQDLGPKEITPPQFMTQAQVHSPTDQATEGGDVWQEDVQVSRIGLPVRTKFLLGLVLVVVVIAIVVFVSKGLRNESAESTADQTTLAQANPNLPTSPNDENSTSRETADHRQPGLETEPDQNVPEPTTPARDQAEPSTRLARLDADTIVVPASPPGDAGSQTADQESAALPPARKGDSSITFAGDLRFPLVLRLLCTQPVGARVKWVGQDQPLVARWPRRPTPLPSAGIEAGRGYLVREGWAVYWGASDHFYLMLDSISGVQVTLNGVSRTFNESAISRWQLVDLNSSNQP